jgi:hypothetical protein
MVAAAPPPIRAAQHRAPATPPSAHARRCADIVQRVSLGEPMTADEREFLQHQCAQP